VGVAVVNYNGSVGHLDSLLTPIGGLSRFSDLGAVPEPATLGLLGIGAAATLIRRRRGR